MTGPLLRISLVKVKQSVWNFFFRSETLLNTIDLMIVIVWEGFQQISSILAVWGDSSFKAHLIKPAFAKLMLQNIQIFTRQQAHQSIVTSMKIILTSSLLTFQVLCTKLKPAVAWFHWQITLVTILHVLDKVVWLQAQPWWAFSFDFKRKCFKRKTLARVHCVALLTKERYSHTASLSL